MALQRLSYDLRMMIANQVAAEDDLASQKGLKSLPYVDREFDAIASARLYKTVGVWLGVNSLQKLWNIAHEPRL